MRSRLCELAAAFCPRKLCSMRTAGTRLTRLTRCTRRARARARTLWRRIWMLVHICASVARVDTVKTVARVQSTFTIIRDSGDTAARPRYFGAAGAETKAGNAFEIKAVIECEASRRRQPSAVCCLRTSNLSVQNSSS
eukprot:6188950-Pleurochrysis_carterae.AAC.2